MRAVIVSHGEIKDMDFASRIMRDSEMLVCADGGGTYAVKCGIMPDVLIGDLDSIDAGSLSIIENSGCKVIKYPREKDYTDTQLAIDYAVEQGANEITILAGTGDRLDHTLANVFLLVKLLKSGITASLVNENNAVYVMNDSIKLQGKRGDLLSLLPVGGDVKGIHTSGLQYKLSGSNMDIGDPLGISNVFTGEEAYVKIDGGYLLVIKSRD